uniref:Protein kinase domain-containing protein n=1 Tax=Fagus sylvatica TaxID=28930 RepID=A0A2N9GX28_FAGSY
MGHQRTLLHLYTYISLLTLSSFTAADDAAAMSKLLAALSPAPSGWSATTACCNWKNLTSLSLQSNSLSGPIPALANLSSLQQLYLDNNNFTSIPNDFFQGLTSLQILTLTQNIDLAPWSIPTELTQATSLVTFYASNANINGSLPDIFASLPSLQDLRLSYNNLTGPLLKSFGGSGIKNLWLNNQLTGLSGKINVLSSMTQLSQAWLHKNQFTGPIPDLSNCTSLFDLQLHYNQFTGLIPASLMLISSLKNVSLDNTELQGPYPKFPSGTKVTLDGINSFCLTTPGLACDPQVTTLLEIAAALEYPIKLASSWSGNNACNQVDFGYLRFAGDNHHCSIPDALTNMTSLQLLDVSNNNLTGLIPNFASTLKLVKSGNPLLGINTPSGGSGGNSPLGSNGTTNNGNPAGTGTSGSSVSPGMIAGIVIAVVTNNFSEDNILGRGGFGVVYKGELYDGTKIAVKRMKSVAMSSRGMKQFDAEIAVLTKVRHRHLVALLGYCLNDNERLLVFEYMPQGTLTQHLFHWGENGCSPLTWKERIIIALDVARGVEYLHSLAQQSFIHRDLKPSNILLGNDRRAKVADFGLVKNVPDGKYSVDTQLAGTFGYFAPEYAATGRVTTKVDVYAFGVILMELITGRKALDDTMSNEGSQLVPWFRHILINKDNIPNAIDQTLNTNEETMESIYKVVELAGYCTTRESYQRPDMGHVVNILCPLVEQWKPTCHEEEHTHSIFHGEEDTYGIDPHMSLSLTLEG